MQNTIPKDKETAMVMINQVETVPTFSRVVVRKIGHRLIFLLLGYREGDLERVVGMRVATVPKKYKALKFIDFGVISQALRQNGYTEAADELKAKMNPQKKADGKLFEFEVLRMPEEI